MKRRKGLFGFTQKTEVPEIVDAKCREAYNTIYNECKNRGEVKISEFSFTCCDEPESDTHVFSGVSVMKPKKFRLGKCLAIVTCAAVMGVFTIPVMAEYIPTLQSAFGFTSKLYTKDPLEKNDLTKYAAPVNQEKKSKCADIVMQSVYADGSNISISIALTPKSDIFKDSTNITAYGDIKLDGERISYVDPEGDENSGYSDMQFVKGEDGVFYSVVHYEGIATKEVSKLEIQINSLQGTNYYMQHGVINEDGSVYYEPEKTELINDEFKFEYDVKPDISNNYIYTVNEMYDDAAIESVDVTPCMTTINVIYLDEQYYLEMYDQDGTKFDGIYVEGDDRPHFSAPLTTSKILIIEVHSLNLDGLPVVHTFEVPIKKGFADKHTATFEQSLIDDSKVVYDPPMEELDAKAEEEWQKKYDELNDHLKSGKINPEPVGTKIPYSAFIDDDHSVDLDVKITGSELDDTYNYEIDEDTWQFCEEHIEGFDRDTAQVLLVTYEITNPTDSVISDCFSGFELETKDLGNSHLYMYTESVYVSNRQNYGKYSNHYDFEPNETYTITYGYLVTEEAMEKGFYVSKLGSYNFEKFINGTEKFYEIE